MTWRVPPRVVGHKQLGQGSGKKTRRKLGERTCGSFFFCEMKDLEITLPSWHAVRLEVGRMMVRMPLMCKYAQETLMQTGTPTIQERANKNP